MFEHTYAIYLGHVIAALGRGMFTKDEISRKVLSYLKKQDWPVTTEMVAKDLSVSWNTAQLHLYKLVTESLVKGRRVGRQNQWIITEKGVREVSG